MIKRTSLAIFGILLGLATATATPLAPQRAGLATAVASLANAPTLGAAQDAANTLKFQFGLTSATPTATRQGPAFATTDTAVLELVDLRLLLAQIAVQTGAKDHLALTRAQNSGLHQVILLRGGFVTLATVAALAKNGPAAAFVTLDAQGITLTRPIVVWSDAGLQLGPTDTLIFSQIDGSFLANLGWLDIQGASVRGTNTANPREPAFRPFLLTAGKGSLTVSDSQFAHLGFGETQRFGGLSVVNAGLQLPQTAPTVQGSQFDDVSMLAAIGTSSVQMTGNQISSGAILIANSKDSIVTDNLLIKAVGQAIRVSNGSDNALISNNIVLGGQAGVSVDQASRQVTLSGNILAGQATSGIRLDKADCVTVSGNLTALGTGTGLSLSATGRVAISGNAILQNADAGILLRDQRREASVLITGNLLAGNHEGLRGATAGNVSLSGNDLEGQLPRLFSGDLAARTITWLEDRKANGVTIRQQNTTTPVCPPKGDI